MRGANDKNSKVRHRDRKGSRDTKILGPLDISEMIQTKKN